MSSSPEVLAHQAAGGALQPQQGAEEAEGEPPPASVGWQDLRQRLLQAGASPAYASAAWARNHYRWVVWKLARLQLLLDSTAAAAAANDGSPAAAAAEPSAPPPQLLTCSIVLDELKYR